MSETHSELLLLPDGRILVQNLTPAMATLLRTLDPQDRGMSHRARTARRRRRSSRAKPQIHRTPYQP